MLKKDKKENQVNAAFATGVQALFVSEGGNGMFLLLNILLNT